jgi:Cystatin domain
VPIGTDKTFTMNLLPRSFATMALAVAAVPGVAPLAAPLHQHGNPAGHAAGQAAPVSARVATPSAGGWTEQDPASPAVLGAAGFAAVSLSETFGGTYVVEHIKHAESQVVEGENFRLKLRIAQLKDDVLGARKDCTVVVWSRPWLKPADQLTSADCQNAGTAVPTLGAKV